MVKKLVAMAVSAALAVSMSPVLAFAQPSSLEAGAVSEQASTAAGTSGKTKTMYVLSRVGNYKVSYSNGLVKKVASSSETVTYGYTGNRMTSYHHTSGWHENSGTFTYDGKGRLAAVDSGGSMGSMTYQEKYKYNSKNLVSKLDHERTGPYTTLTFKYNKKKRMTTKIVKYHMSNSSLKTKFTYDKKGNIVKEKEGRYTLAYKNVYKKGRLAKRSFSGSAFSKPIKYKYKKIKVPQGSVAQVKKQQWTMLNYNASYGVIPVGPFGIL